MTGSAYNHALNSLLATARSIAQDLASGALFRILGLMRHSRCFVICLEENREVVGQDICSIQTMPCPLSDKWLLKI